MRSVRNLAPAGAWRFIILLGVISLFSDITYEGARSISGPFLWTLKASALVVGVVAGLGEFLGYALRLGSGYLADRLGRYWLITFTGYSLNLLAVPLLALAGSWELPRRCSCWSASARPSAPRPGTPCCPTPPVR